MIKVNGVEIPTPSSLTVGHQDLSKAERNARGDLIGEFITKKVKLEFTWQYTTPAQMQQILSAVSPFFFTVEYPDPELNALQTLTFYKGDRKMPMYSYVNGQPRWKDLGFNVIQR